MFDFHEALGYFLLQRDLEATFGNARVLQGFHRRGIATRVGLRAALVGLGEALGELAQIIGQAGQLHVLAVLTGLFLGLINGLGCLGELFGHFLCGFFGAAALKPLKVQRHRAVLDLGLNHPGLKRLGQGIDQFLRHLLGHIGDVLTIGFAILLRSLDLFLFDLGGLLFQLLGHSH